MAESRWLIVAGDNPASRRFCSVPLHHGFIE
jgi:hypothetical protein